MPETTTTPHVQRYSPIPGWGLELELRVLRVPNLLYGVIGGGFTAMGVSCRRIGPQVLLLLSLMIFS